MQLLRSLSTESIKFKGRIYLTSNCMSKNCQQLCTKSYLTILSSVHTLYNPKTNTLSKPESVVKFLQCS